MKNCLAFLLLFLLGAAAPAQTGHRELALNAYLTSDPAAWRQAITAAEGQISDETTRRLTQAEYQLAGAFASFGRGDDAARDRFMNALDSNLDAYWKLDDANATAHGLYSALLGLRIARKPMSAMIYGSRAGSYAKKAIKLDANHPTALYHAAGNLYYTPEQWGGDPALAIAYLEKSVAAYAGDATNYRYLEALARLGEVQASVGQTEAARATYQRALAARPDFAYVSQVLLPKLDGSK